MELQVLTGTWEEIRAHDAELTGRRVQLTILPNEHPLMLDQVLASLIEEAENLTLTPVRAPLDDPKSALSEAIAEKFRRQGLNV
ncbi:MAG: hypothetical protein M3Y56_12390 [Armatimonadota bacterium]|nr:hypothetical protein [Armatimonadota bacterium]